MSRALVAAWLLLWMGATLLLGEVRALARPRLGPRLQPYAPGGWSRPRPTTPASVAELLGPLARSLGERLARLSGVTEDAAARLERIHSPLDVTAFRVRQLGWATAALAAAALAVSVLQLGSALALLVLGGAPLLAFLVVEQQLSAASSAWQRRLQLELPVVSEQLAMLLGAGFSLGAALQRLSTRSAATASAADLDVVCSRLRQGLSEVDAVREWAVRARIAALDRLVAVLALNREGGDLGRLLAEEARAIRRDVQRDLVETMERRGQQVWIPVTVATLVPGVLFLSIPFVEALRLFSGS